MELLTVDTRFSVHPVVTLEQPVADGNHVVEETRGQEEENQASENSGNEPGMGINRIGNSGC